MTLSDSRPTVELVFSCDEPHTLEALQILVERHSEAIERVAHGARATVQAGAAPSVELSLQIQDSSSGPACELEALAAVHDLEISLAAEGFALRQLRSAA